MNTTNHSILKILLKNNPNFDVMLGHSFGDPYRHVFLAAAIAKLKPAQNKLKILEIGSWTGYSAFTIAQALNTYHPQCESLLVCVDPWQDYEDFSEKKDHFSQLYHFGLSSDLIYPLFLHNISFLNTPNITVQPLRGLSKDILPLLKNKFFDLIYIDGDHAYEHCLSDIQYAKTLIKNQGIICGDDLNLRLEDCDPEFARKNAHASNIVDPKTSHPFHPGVTLAVSESFKEYSCYCGLWLVQQSGKQYLPVDLSNINPMIPAHFSDNLKTLLQSRLCHSEQ